MKLLERVKDKRLRYFLIGVFIGLIFSGTVIFGRYAYMEVRNFYLASKNFYFNSDKLDENGSSYQVDNWSGADSYVITFNMDSFKNNKVFASSDITYDIEFSCSESIICESSEEQGVILATTHTDSFSITLTPQVSLKDGDSVWVEVKTTSTYPYVKTLTGKFVIKVGKMGLSFSIDDVSNRTYLDVNITNTLDFYTVDTAFSTYNVGDRISIDTYLGLSDEDKEKCSSAIITLNFDPDVVLLDMTTSAYLRAIDVNTTLIDGHSYINQFSFKVDALSSEVVRFYKQNAFNNYTYPFDNSNPVVEVTYS